MGLKKFFEGKGKVAATLIAPVTLAGMLGLSQVKLDSLEDATDYVKDTQAQNSETIKEIESELEAVGRLEEGTIAVVDAGHEDENAEIEERIASLNELADKLSDMLDKVEQSKSEVSPELQAEIDKLHEKLNEIGLVNSENAKQIEDIYKQLVELGKSVSEISAKQEIKYDIEASRTLNTLGCKLAKIELDLAKHIRTGKELNHEEIVESLTNLESSLNDLALNGQIPENVYKELEGRIVSAFDSVCLCNYIDAGNKTNDAMKNGAMNCVWNTTESADGSNKTIEYATYTYVDGNHYNVLNISYNKDGSKVVTKDTYEKQSTNAEDGKNVFVNVKSEIVNVDKNGKCSNYKLVNSDLGSTICILDGRYNFDNVMEMLGLSNPIFEYNKDENSWSLKSTIDGNNQKVTYNVDEKTGKILQLRQYDETNKQASYYNEVPELFADMYKKVFENLGNISMFNITPMVDEPQQNQ